ncbi:unnamed protein product [Effrenium voratum]|nr:unnamed protein product [Effrenium voratum]
MAAEPTDRLPWRYLVAGGAVVATAICTRRPKLSRAYAPGLGAVLTLVAALLATANRVLYKVALVPLGNYVFFLAQFTTFGYVFAYWSALLFNRSRGAISDKQVLFARSRWRTFASIGALEAGSVLLGMLGAKALPGAILPVLGQLFLVFQMSFSTALLGRRYSLSELAGCACCVSGVLTASTGSHLALEGFEFTPALLFVTSLGLPALGSVLKERLFADARRQCEEELNVFVVNTLGSSCQATCVLLLLPLLASLQGVGASPKDIAAYLTAGAKAFVSAPLWPCLYLGLNLCFNVSILVLLRTTSAVSVSLSVAMAVPMTALVFASCDVPLLGRGQPLDRSFGLGLVLILGGLCLYHGWIRKFLAARKGEGDLADPLLQ